ERVRQRIIAAKALRFYSKNEEAYKALEVALTDTDPEVRAAAAVSLQTLDPKIARTIRYHLNPVKLRAFRLTALDVQDLVKQPPGGAKAKIIPTDLGIIIECELPPSGGLTAEQFDKLFVFPARGRPPLPIPMRSVAIV